MLLLVALVGSGIPETSYIFLKTFFFSKVFFSNFLFIKISTHKMPWEIHHFI